MDNTSRPFCRPQIELLEDRNLPNNLLGLGSGLAPGLANLGIPGLDIASLLQETQFAANPTVSHGAPANTATASAADASTLNAGTDGHLTNASVESGSLGADPSASVNSGFSSD